MVPPEARPPPGGQATPAHPLTAAAPMPEPARGEAAGGEAAEIGALLSRAACLAEEDLHGRLRRHGATVPEWRVMEALLGGAATVGSLAGRCAMQQPTMTKLLRRMSRAGLLEREDDAGDRRLVWVRLSPAGLSRSALLRPQAQAHGQRLASRLAPGEAALLRGLLRALLRPAPASRNH